MNFLLDFFMSIIGELAMALGIPLFLLLLGYIFPFNQTIKTIPFDPIECEDLSKKRLSGCYWSFGIIAIFLALLHFPFWQPMYNYFCSIPGALVNVKPSLFVTILLSFYLAFPLTINASNYWFARKYGKDKATELHSFYSNKYHLNNVLFEKWLYRITIIFSVFLIFFFFNEKKAVTEDKIYYSNPFSLIPKTEKIENVEKIEHFDGEVAPNGDISPVKFFIVTFKNGEIWKALASNIFDKDEISEIIKIIAKKQNLIIQEKGIKNKTN
jgi:hypothetical protein